MIEQFKTQLAVFDEAINQYQQPSTLTENRELSERIFQILKDMLQTVKENSSDADVMSAYQNSLGKWEQLSEDKEALIKQDNEKMATKMPQAKLTLRLDNSTA